jgi:hypothetical protein
VYTGVNNILGGGGIVEFLQASTGYMQLTTGSKLYVSPQTQLKLGNKYKAGGSQFWFADQTALLFLDNCSLEIGGCTHDHITFTSGTVYINGAVSLQANYSGCYLQFGDGVNSSNNCNVVILPGSQLILDSGATLSNCNV